MTGELETRLTETRNNLSKAAQDAGRAAEAVTLIAVSKTFDADAIRPALEAGQRVFGENRVQESQGKWPGLMGDYPDTQLHLIGPLQSNKAEDAVALFHCIHTVDREKIASALAKAMAKLDKQLTFFVQVNTGEEEQKAGVDPYEAVAFVKRCQEVHGLSIRGLMCIPPFDENPGPHFALLRKLAREAGVEELSMGMSGDYETAIAMGATHVRVGSAIFGARG
ncbi:MAG: YggS family pyridoxal phosphate-dependent enzyme [Pseudomonadota bacterium]